VISSADFYPKSGEYHDRSLTDRSLGGAFKAALKIFYHPRPEIERISSQNLAFRSHRNGSLANRWQHFSWFGVENIPEKIGSITALAQLEAICIALAEPRFNKQSGAFADADQVYQVPHPDADGDLETKLNRLMEQINS